MAAHRPITCTIMLTNIVTVLAANWAYGAQVSDDNSKIKQVESCSPDFSPIDRPGYLQFATCMANRHGLPQEVAHAVIEIESNFKPQALGGDGEIGLMQVLPSTARLLGFSGTSEDLAKPETNITFGVKYLSQAWKISGQDLCTTLMKYRAGHNETRFSYLSVQYCLRARAILLRDGYEISGTLPTATFGFSGGMMSNAGSKGGTCLRRSFVPGPAYGRCLFSSSKISQAKAVALRRSIFGN